MDDKSKIYSKDIHLRYWKEPFLFNGNIITLQVSGMSITMKNLINGLNQLKIAM